VSGVPLELPVRVFAAYADVVGAPYTTVCVSEPATVGALRRALAQHADARGWPAAIARAPIAVNLEYARDDRPISPTDEIALIPPVAGG
jgi:molybdopterin converting factor small subunit